ncbi:hypothetical protein KAFR_0B02260 [Kazachstania africana CBS 2517]|uniref:RNA polymerase II subunit B1 CTD phosphatase RPAP2 homolog n=1 Tax=Kazachstania africana (strain ATCC 22294 / BCRC 22015 / CBS 2517 / CECT 1963 / NBRC 1671 / NRRL Y-8276) TaxID=1071382 RepID=H2AQ74_KAZAF|nr:hypothetical protein KAFR_0B02260 [Kazachstania africana CBS 2517]CCF56524.1 hypothetical protein KAFR_0B02260 [Kazachstania africana CBS 2517]
MSSVSVQTIHEKVLKPFQKHRQLSIRESELLILELLELLCDTALEDELSLKYIARFLTPETYSDLVEERNINNRCGYPLCTKSPERSRIKTNNAKIENFLLENNPYAYLSMYCNKFHFRCSQFYQLQLSDEALFTRVGIHLIVDTIPKQGEENTVTLFEELLRERATNEDIKSLISSLKKLGLQGHEGDANKENEDEILEQELSKWLGEINIVENENPDVLGDLTRED